MTIAEISTMTRSGESTSSNYGVFGCDVIAGNAAGNMTRRGPIMVRRQLRVFPASALPVLPTYRPAGELQSMRNALLLSQVIRTTGLKLPL